MADESEEQELRRLVAAIRAESRSRSEERSARLAHRLIRSVLPLFVMDEGDRFDLAVHHLSDESLSRLSELRFSRLSDVAFDDPGPRAVFTIFGYPGVWTQPNIAEADQLSVKPLKFTTYAYDGNTAGIDGYHAHTHLLLSAGAEDTSAPDGQPLEFRDRLGQPVRLPIALKGVSGCVRGTSGT